MIIKWYNRDAISDQDMKRSEAVARRLLGIKSSITVNLPPAGEYLFQINEAFWHKYTEEGK